MNVFLLYFTIYYSQIDEQFERINQIIKIVLRFAISLLINFKNYSKILFKLQRVFNNNVLNIDHILNEIVYDFTSIQSSLISISIVVVDIVSINIRVVQRIIRFEIIDVIALNQMFAKLNYDKKH